MDLQQKEEVVSSCTIASYCTNWSGNSSSSSNSISCTAPLVYNETKRGVRAAMRNAAQDANAFTTHELSGIDDECSSGMYGLHTCTHTIICTTHMHTHMYIHTCTHMYTHTCTHTCTYAHVHTHMHTHVHTHTYIHTHVHTHVHMHT